MAISSFLVGLIYVFVIKEEFDEVATVGRGAQGP